MFTHCFGNKSLAYSDPVSTKYVLICLMIYTELYHSYLKEVLCSVYNVSYHVLYNCIAYTVSYMNY